MNKIKTPPDEKGFLWILIDDQYWEGRADEGNHYDDYSSFLSFLDKPNRAEPSPTEPSRAPPSRAEPHRAKPSPTEPSRAEPSPTEPHRAEPSQAEPNK